jgi:hypothetical protein
MKKITKEYKIYKYEELSESAKETVLENHYSINVDYDWWDFCYEDFKQQLNNIGIECESFYFSLDRDNYIAMDKPIFNSREKYFDIICKESNNEYIKKLYKHKSFLWEAYENLCLNTKCYAGGITSNYISIDNVYTHSDLIGKLEEEAENYLQNKLEEFKDTLKKEYEYLTSEEAILETIESNEYTFLEDGTMFNE